MQRVRALARDAPSRVESILVTEPVAATAQYRPRSAPSQGAVAVRQDRHVLQRLLQRLRDLLARQLLFRIRRVHDEIIQIRAALFAVAYLVPFTVAAKPVRTLVRRDPIQPGGEASFRAELRQVAPGG